MILAGGTGRNKKSHRCDVSSSEAAGGESGFPRRNFREPIAKFGAYRLVNPPGPQQVPIRCGQGTAGQRNYEINRTAA